jgi:alkylation response protein AidB-like acyl-CoA dehydrogenase
MLRTGIFRGVPMNFSWTGEQKAFRQRVRTFIDAHLPADWERLTEGLDVGSDYTVAFSRTFCPALARAGLLVPHWPAAYGGLDADAWHHWILNEEMIRSGEPRSYQYMSVNWAGPALMQFGTGAQKAELLPRIAAGTLVFCQGFSEPNAGSDLVSLKTAARADGAGWRITGQKIWTSAASFADYCILLARTGDSGRKGITMFLVSMSSPGIQVRVIPSKMGARALHEVFFEDVRVGPEAVLGAVDEGWEVVGRILHNERIGIPRYIISLHALDRALAVLSRPGRMSDVAWLQAKRARAACEAARLQCYKVIDARVKGASPSAETHLARIGLVMADRLVAEFLGDHVMHLLVGEDEPVIAGAYRRTAATGIASGTAEIQLDLIARNHLQLPRAVR